MLRRVRHPSIIQLIEVDETPSQLFLVMELVKVPPCHYLLLFPASTSCSFVHVSASFQGGDLFDAITSSTKYSERDASAMVFNLAGAIKYLHRMNIVHRDIKPENLLVCIHKHKYQPNRRNIIYKRQINIKKGAVHPKVKKTPNISYPLYRPYTYCMHSGRI